MVGRSYFSYSARALSGTFAEAWPWEPTQRRFRDAQRAVVGRMTSHGISCHIHPFGIQRGVLVEHVFHQKGKHLAGDGGDSAVHGRYHREALAPGGEQNACLIQEHQVVVAAAWLASSRGTLCLGAVLSALPAELPRTRCQGMRLPRPKSRRPWL